jgi:hypothetical protein
VQVILHNYLKFFAFLLIYWNGIKGLSSIFSPLAKKSRSWIQGLRPHNTLYFSKLTGDWGEAPTPTFPAFFAVGKKRAG